MRSVALQQENDALMNCKMLFRKKGRCALWEEQSCIEQEEEIKDQVKEFKIVLLPFNKRTMR
jgi:hypothetical protein